MKTTFAQFGLIHFKRLALFVLETTASQVFFESLKCFHSLPLSHFAPHRLAALLCLEFVHGVEIFTILAFKDLALFLPGFETDVIQAFIMAGGRTLSAFKARPFIPPAKGEGSSDGKDS